MYQSWRIKLKTIKEKDETTYQIKCTSTQGGVTYEYDSDDIHSMENTRGGRSYGVSCLNVVE